MHFSEPGSWRLSVEQSLGLRPAMNFTICSQFSRPVDRPKQIPPSFSRTFALTP